MLPSIDSRQISGQLSIACPCSAIAHASSTGILGYLLTGGMPWRSIACSRNCAERFRSYNPSLTERWTAEFNRITFGQNRQNSSSNPSRDVLAVASFQVLVNPPYSKSWHRSHYGSWPAPTECFRDDRQRGDLASVKWKIHGLITCRVVTVYAWADAAHACLCVMLTNPGSVAIITYPCPPMSNSNKLVGSKWSNKSSKSSVASPCASFASSNISFRSSRSSIRFASMPP